MCDNGEVVQYKLLCGLPECREIFYICCSCYRGHKYCSDACRGIARRRQMDAARRRYLLTPEAKLDQRDRQRRWRMRRVKKTVMDQRSVEKIKMRSSPGRNCAARRLYLSVVFLALKNGLKHVSGAPRCVVCGRSGRLVNPYHDIRRYKT